MAGKVSKTLEKYGTIAQHQLAIRQSGFFGFVTTKILNRFLVEEAVKRSIVEQISCTTIGRFLKSGTDKTASVTLLAES